MNRDDIIRMAREAGLNDDGGVWYSRSDVDADVTTEDLERFANLVATAEREACTRVYEEMRAEHEMCARVNEEVRNDALWEFRS